MVGRGNVFFSEPAVSSKRYSKADSAKNATERNWCSHTRMLPVSATFQQPIKQHTERESAVKEEHR